MAKPLTNLQVCAIEKRIRLVLDKKRISIEIPKNRIQQEYKNWCSNRLKEYSKETLDNCVEWSEEHSRVMITASYFSLPTFFECMGYETISRFEGASYHEMTTTSQASAYKSVVKEFERIKFNLIMGDSDILYKLTELEALIESI